MRAVGWSQSGHVPREQTAGQISEAGTEGRTGGVGGAGSKLWSVQDLPKVKGQHNP